MKIKRIPHKSIYSCCHFIVEYLGVCIWFVCNISKDRSSTQLSQTRSPFKRKRNHILVKQLFLCPLQQNRYKTLAFLLMFCAIIAGLYFHFKNCELILNYSLLIRNYTFHWLLYKISFIISLIFWGNI